MTLVPSPVDAVLGPSQSVRLVQAAGRAPSGDNNQPWAFHAGDEHIDVLHRRKAALPSDVQDLFSWLSLGAAIENLVLAAGREGLSADVDYRSRPFDIIGGCEHVARVRLAHAPQPLADSLADWIDQRCTNRRPYAAEPLPAVLLDALADSASGFAPPVQWLADPAGRRQLARLVVAADRVRFETRAFHEEFHAVLRYTPQSAQATRDGLDLRTFEAPPATALIFRVLRPWRRMQVANRLGMSRLMAGTSTRLLTHCGAIGLLCSAAATDVAYLDSGRALERIWLAATREGLAFQPMGALPLFLQRLAVLGDAAFPERHLRTIAALRGPFTQLFPAAEGVPVLLFRMGRAPDPSARSLRYPPGALIVRDPGDAHGQPD